MKTRKPIRIKQEPINRGWLGAAMLALGMLWVSPAAPAATWVGASWDTSANLDVATNGIYAPTTIGSAVNITAGRFGNGINIPTNATAATGTLSYDGSGSDFASQGTVSFWYKPGIASASFVGDRILSIDTAAGTAGRLVDIYNISQGQFDVANTASGYANSSQAHLSWGANDWLYFAFEWNAANNIYKLWVGDGSTGTTAINTLGYGNAWTPDVTANVSINIGSIDATGDSLTPGTWDDLYIGNQLLYNPSLSSILIPTVELVPEPSMGVLAAMGGLLLFHRRSASYGGQGQRRQRNG